MADYYRPQGRATEEERERLLERGEESSSGSDSDSRSGRFHEFVQEPLTPLTKILLILALVLLLLSSIFIGLFAGAQHKLNSGGDHLPGREPITKTTTAISTKTATTTATTTSITTATTTRGAITTTEIKTTTESQTITTTSTSTATSTATVTKSVPIPGPPIPGPTGKPPQELPCLEPHCIVLASSILSSLDVTQDPCENFYDFSNGNWLNSHPLPADKDSFGKFESLAQENKQVIQKILESKGSSDFGNPYDDEILTKLRDHYASCLNEDGLDEIGQKPLLRFVKNIRKLYREEDTDVSLLENREQLVAEKRDFKFNGLTAATALLHSRGIGALFNFDVEGDVGVDPDYMMLWFSQPELGLPSKEYYEEDSIRDIYQVAVQHLLLSVLSELDDDDSLASRSSSTSSSLINNADSKVWPPWPWPPWGGDDDDDDRPPQTPSNDTARAQKLAKGVVKFERKLAQASLDLDILYQDPIATYNPAPIHNLTRSLPQIDFPAYFSTFTPRTYPDRVILTYPSYSVSLSDILDETPSEIIEAYLVTRAALSLSPYLGMSTPAWQAQRALYEALSGIKKGAVGDRAEYCISRVEETLGFATGRYFVNETFGGDSKTKATKVITDVVKAFKASLSDIDWMDYQSAHAAAEKADAIRIKVGYPKSPDTNDAHSIALYYNNVKISKDSFFSNMLSAAATSEFKKWLQLGKRRNLESWEMFPSTVNAYFNPPSNEIVFPAGILQPPFFAKDWPGYLSYGAFGQVASHELTHAFDSAGRLYNQHGKLEEWWTPATSRGFQRKQKCIVDQYSKYTIDDGKGHRVPVNGNLTSGENIGDSGLIQAYRAWKNQFEDSKEDGNEYLLPGLRYTRDQLFFIAFGQIWARAMKPAAALRRIRTDPHSPTRYRVDGTLSNIPEFAKAFNCPKGSKLNPPNEDRCMFWG